MPLPDVHLHNGQDRISLDLDHLSECAALALTLVLAEAGPEEPVLPELAEIEVSFVSDEVIGDIHGRFLNDPAPTDVITFQHGEILISADTAAATASSWGHSPDRESMLYIIHGLLHLNGHEDRTARGAALMKECQENILAAVWPQAVRRD